MNKSTLIAIVVFAGLAIAVASTMREKPQRGVTSLSLDEVDASSVDRMVIGGDDGVTLERDGDRWTLDGKLADGKVVERVVESVAGLHSSDLASRNPDRFAELEVDDEKGARVRLFSKGNVVADLVVGGAAPRGSYVRSGDEVYTVEGVYRSSLAREPAGWLERKVFFDEVEDVERVEIMPHQGVAYAVVKKDDTWQLEDPSSMSEGQRFDAEAAARLVRSLVTVRADDILDGEPDGAGALAEDADRFEFRVSGDAEPRRLELAPEKDGAVLARSSAREPFFTLRPAVANGLRKTLADLRDYGLVALEPDRIERLEVDDGGDRLVLEKEGGSWTLASSSSPLPEDFELDPAAVTRRLGLLDRAKAIAEASAEQAFDPSAASQKVVATLEDGTAVALAFGPESEVDAKKVVAAVGNVDDKVYLVESSTRDRLLGGIESFERVAPVLPQNGLGGIDPEALKNLPPEVRDSLLRQMAEEQQRQQVMQRAMEAAK